MDRIAIMAMITDAELWAIQPAEITSLPPLPSMTDVTGATCSVSPSLPTGLSIDSSTCTISGTPSVATSNTTYNITADISGTTLPTTFWLSSSYPQLIPSVEGAELIVGQAMTDITFQDASGTYNGNGTAWLLHDIEPGFIQATQPNSQHLETR